MDEQKKLTITKIENGYIEPVITPDDYISGGERSIANKLGIVEQPIQPDGQWDAFLPTTEEVQVKGFETCGCVAFNSTNQIEILERKVFAGNSNYSDRALYIMANIAPPGTDPQIVYETIRKQGLIYEQELPWSDDIKTLEQYASPKPLPKILINKAKGWLLKYIFKHEYLPRNINGWVNPETIKEKLKFSPLGVAVFAWASDGEKYVRAGNDTHWTCIFGIHENGDYKCWDSYPPFIKRLDKNFGFKVAKRIWLNQNLNPQQIDWFLKILDTMFKILTLQWLWVEEKKKEEAKPIEPIEPKKEEYMDKLKEPFMKKESKLIPFAKAIESYEYMKLHYASYNNPGALKYTDYTAKLGAYAAGMKGFAMFHTYEDGFNALCQLCQDAADNKLKAYHDKDIKGFFEVYAPASDNNFPLRYASWVADKIDETVESKLKDFI